MKKSKLISALAPLRPYRVTDVDTGEILNQVEVQGSLSQLVEYCHEQTVKLYETNKSKLLKDVTEYKSHANAFGRKHGYASEYKTLPREVKAKSRVNELILFKLITETTAFVLNPQSSKREHSFNYSINLGSVDKQMVTLAIDPAERVLTLLFKCWDRELLLEFSIPAYVFKYDIKKWSLPLIKRVKDEYVFIFTIQENIPERSKGIHSAGVDLGRVEPYTLAITNKNGARVAHYTSSKLAKKLSVRQDRLRVEGQHLKKKIQAYTDLGLNTSILEINHYHVTQKTINLTRTLAKTMGSEIARKLSNHSINTLHVEQLNWVSGTREARVGTTRWAYSTQQEAITQASLRKGVHSVKVNPAYSSKSCHKCGTLLTERGRSVYCRDCKSLLDRDFNAALNLASLNHLHYWPYSYRESGVNDSSREQVNEGDESHPPISVLGHTSIERYPT